MKFNQYIKVLNSFIWFLLFVICISCKKKQVDPYPSRIPPGYIPTENYIPIDLIIRALPGSRDGIFIRIKYVLGIYWPLYNETVNEMNDRLFMDTIETKYKVKEFIFRYKKDSLPNNEIIIKSINDWVNVNKGHKIFFTKHLNKDSLKSTTYKVLDYTHTIEDTL